MKRVLLLLALLIPFLSAFAQDSEKADTTVKQIVVPEVVQKAFQSNFTAAKKVEWGMEKPGIYEAEFKDGKFSKAALFDANGVLQVTETKLKATELPESITSYLEKEYSDFKISRIEKVLKGSVETIELIAKKEHLKFELIFDKDGKFVSKGIPPKTVKKDKKEKKDSKAKED